MTVLVIICLVSVPLNVLFVWYIYKISDLITPLINAGFKIERIEEPDPRKKDKYTSKEITPEAFLRKAMKKIPRTIIIKSKK